MKCSKFLSVFAALLTAAVGVASARESIKIPDTLVPTQERDTVNSVKFPPVVNKDGYRVILKGRFFYQGPKVSGWNVASFLTLNGKKLQEFTADGQARLLRRGEVIKFTNGTTSSWFDKRFGMLILFGSDQNKFDKRIAPESCVEGYWYNLDISDLVDSRKENTLQITNGMRALGKTASLKDYVLACKDMEILLMPAEEADKLRPKSAAEPVAKPAAPASSVKTTQTLRTKAEVLSNGEMLLPELEIFPQARLTSGRITFPAVRRLEGKIPVLQAEIYFNHSKASGWNNATNIVLNGKQLGRYTAEGNERLLRRGAYMESTQGKNEWWVNSMGLLVYFAPGKGELDKRVIAPRQEGFIYLLDVSDLLNLVEVGLDDRIESAKENILVINNGLLNHPRNGSLGKSPLTFKNARIIWMDPEEVKKIRPKQPLREIEPSAAAAVLDNGDFQVTVTSTGGLQLERNGEKYFLDAAFSYPAKPEMKFDTLGVAQAVGRKGWQPQVKNNGKSIVVTAQTADRKVQRTIKFTGKLLEISDAITNLTKQDMPLLSQYSAFSVPEIKPQNLYLAGMQGITTETGCGANPTLYIQGSKSGFGAMALEDAFRCHLELARTGANSASLKHPTALAPQETYVQKQLVMLTGKADYFDFINTLRHHLKLNHTLNGPVTLNGRVNTVEQYRVAFALTKPQWFEYGGVDSLRRPRTEFIRQYNDARAKYQATAPGTTVLVFTENSPATVDKSQLSNGHLLPMAPDKYLSGTYGEPISKEATEVLNNTPWADSILRTADGRAIIDLYYSYGKDMLSLLVYPYKDNHYKKVLWERTDFLLNDAKVDGIYIDQFANGTMYAVERSRDRISFEKWDGRTVLLNADGTIKSKLFDVGYACSPTRADYVRYVLSKGKFFLANTQPVTTTEAAAGGMRFYESDSENLGPMLQSTAKPPTYRLQAFAQLSPSPVLLGSRPARFNKDPKVRAKMYNRSFIGGLRHGLLYIHYVTSAGHKCYGLVDHMFPLTPVELGEGFVIGKERIVTAVSRKFITDIEPRKIVGFGPEGEELHNVAAVKKLAHNKFEVDVKLNDWNSSCVIVLSGYANVAEEQAALKKK